MLSWRAGHFGRGTPLSREAPAGTRLFWCGSHSVKKEKRHSDSSEQNAGPARRKGHAFWRMLLILIAIVALIGVGVRAALPGFVRKYVNRTLDRNPTYSGRIGAVRIHLWRGAYSIEDIRLSKTTGNVPVPFFAAKQVDFAIQWDALLHRRIVGRVLMQNPEMNFVDGETEAESQTGAGGPWLQIIRDLFPFKINRALVQNGAVHFRTYKKETPVDVHIDRVEATVDNLGNIREETKPLASTVHLTGLMMDHAKVELNMTLDPFSYRPTFQMGLRLLGLDVTKLNDLALAYGKFDFKRGWFDLVVEADAKEGQLSGYVKPLFRDLKVFSLSQDIKEKNVLQVFWQALVGAVTTVFKNFPRDQFGTRIPFTGDLSKSTTVDILATIGNVLRNAFVRAYLPRLETDQPAGGLQFGPADFTEDVSVSGAQ
jgi:hypothetical protein